MDGNCLDHSGSGDEGGSGDAGEHPMFCPEGTVCGIQILCMNVIMHHIVVMF